MPFFLFVLVNAALFIRPAEILPSTAEIPVYNIVILACLCFSIGRVFQQLSFPRLIEQPISACVVTTLVAIVLSHVFRFDVWAARKWGFEFLKVVLYYFMMLAIIDTPARLRSFLTWLLILITILTGLALTQYHGLVDIPALRTLERNDEVDENTGEQVVVVQLRSTGIFNDPNDLCLILVVGIALAAHRLVRGGSGLDRILGVGMLGLFIYALILTRSRGGFLAMLGTLGVVLHNRVGWRRTLLVAVVVVPAFMVLSGGRQSKISTTEGTAQQRIKLWRDGVKLFETSPLFGIGAENFADQVGLVAHNSYVQAYTELGMLGGTSFVGLSYFALVSLIVLGSQKVIIHDPELRFLRPFLLAATVGYFIGLLSVSRTYIVPTYMVVGFTAVFVRMTQTTPPAVVPRLDGRQLVRLGVVSVSSMMAIYVFIRTAVQ